MKIRVKTIEAILNTPNWVEENGEIRNTKVLYWFAKNPKKDDFTMNCVGQILEVNRIIPKSDYNLLHTINGGWCIHSDLVEEVIEP